MRCGARAARYGRSVASPGLRSRPSWSVFNERHGTASVYRVWRSHLGGYPCDQVIRPPAACRSHRFAPNRPRPARKRRKVPPKSAIGRVTAATSSFSNGKPAGFSPPQPCLARHPRLLTPPTTGARPRFLAPWRGGRVVDCTALEMRHRCKPIGGSNPSLSAKSSNDLELGLTLASDQRF